LADFSDDAEGGAEAYEDPFDEPPYDWRPETFYAPGDPQRFGTSFADVGGMEALKEEIRLKITYPLQFPDLYKAYGRGTGGGILIYGPPGCGKTLMLRAVAGEVPCNYLSVGLHEIFDPYFGSTERNLHQIFETARANAPCVLVFDDLDSLAQDRRHVRESQMRNLVNQFLHEMDGLRDNPRVLVIGATNQPWQIDPAFRRPGRFDQAIFVPPPDAAARAEIISLQARGKPISNLDVPALVAATEGFSGADLEWVFSRAAEMTLSAAIHSGQAVPIPMDLLLNVARGHRLRIGRDRSSRSAARGRTTCRASISTCHSASSASSPAPAARASRRSPSTPSTPRASAATWRPFRPTRGSSSSAWTSRRWMPSTASRPPSPSSR
jgi:transitional endoplasmic reticulum ATPase